MSKKKSDKEMIKDLENRVKFLEGMIEGMRAQMVAIGAPFVQQLTYNKDAEKFNSYTDSGRYEYESPWWGVAPLLRM